MPRPIKQPCTPGKIRAGAKRTNKKIPAGETINRCVIPCSDLRNPYASNRSECRLIAKKRLQKVQNKTRPKPKEGREAQEKTATPGELTPPKTRPSRRIQRRRAAKKKRDQN